MVSKRNGKFDRDDYAPVADRVALFYERFPMGRIVTHLVDRSDRGVVFPRRSTAAWTSAARQRRDGQPSVRGTARSTRWRVSENTETSAVGRALANLGFTASKQRASAEEMAKVARERARRNLSPGGRDLIALIRAAERAGWSREDGARLRERAAREPWPAQ